MTARPLPEARDDGVGFFRSIACGVDGTRAGFEAASQAAVLTPPDGALRLLAVTWETGTLASGMARLARHRAEGALDRARLIVREHGLEAETVLIEGPHAADRMLDAASGADLLVVGSSGRSHAGGLILGRAADAVLRCAPASVLVARHSAADTFPGAILVTVDEHGDAVAAAEVAGAIARRHRGPVTLLNWSGHGPARHHALAMAGAALTAATDVEPVVVDGHGSLHAAAAHAAEALGATLVVAAGDHAIRTAECARCSVLVLRRSVP